MTVGMVVVIAGSIMTGWNFGKEDWGNMIAGLLFAVAGFMVP